MIVNLAVDDWVSGWISVPRLAVAACIHIDPGTLGWGESVVDLQWKNDDGTTGTDMAAVTFSPAIQFSSSTPGYTSIALGGASHIRFTTTTAAGAADSAAPVVVTFR